MFASVGLRVGGSHRCDMLYAIYDMRIHSLGEEHLGVAIIR